MLTLAFQGDGAPVSSSMSGPAGGATGAPKAPRRPSFIDMGFSLPGVPRSGRGLVRFNVGLRKRQAGGTFFRLSQLQCEDLIFGLFLNKRDLEQSTFSSTSKCKRGVCFFWAKRDFLNPILGCHKKSSGSSKKKTHTHTHTPGKKHLSPGSPGR